MEKNTLKKILPAAVFILFLIPAVTSSLLDLRQRQENEIIAAQLLAQQQAEAKAAEKIYLLGQFDPSQRSDFTVVPANYDIGGYTMYLRQETLSAFLEMAAAAQKDGVDLKIASATRNFDYQKNLWNNKWNALPKSMSDLEKFQNVLEYSAVPGTSRHHWGTEIDFNNANPQYFNTEEGKEVYNWMSQNAWEYGFCQTYTAKGPDRPTGYDEEKWHWSYLPLSIGFTEDYKNLVTEADIKGFDGDQFVAQANLIQNYVLGINPKCL
ncbi:MAG: M15 family metallopeptidase [Candidatus Pacebacteria bacterium]|nr:M15 family metallopeptidase [Candidatus Paceibacterota bacterium]